MPSRVALAIAELEKTKAVVPSRCVTCRALAELDGEDRADLLELVEGRKPDNEGGGWVASAERVAKVLSNPALGYKAGETAVKRHRANHV